MRPGRFATSPDPDLAEMSSIDPVVVLTTALEKRGEHIATELAASVVLGCGQFCTNQSLVLGARSAAFDNFLEQPSARLADRGRSDHAQRREPAQLRARYRSAACSP